MSRLNSMKSFLILHGWGANSRSNWFPWLKTKLEELGHKVYCPNLPNTNNPIQEEWLSMIRKLDGIKFEENLSIIGHSLGSITILRILEQLGENETERIDKAILVSGFTRALSISELENFFSTPFNWKKIQKKANKIFVINSDNDQFFPIEEGELLAKNLNTRLIVEHGLEHINAGDLGEEFGYKRVLNLLLGRD